MKNKLIQLSTFGFIFLAGCRPAETISYEKLCNGLTNCQAVAWLDAPSTQIISSYDRTGANEDYNQFVGRTKAGQCILADLKGPGVVSRFWFTGIDSDKKIRFYFDGSKTPALEFTWNDLRSGVSPFDLSPLSADEQNCWYTFVPVPFQKHLLITTEDAGYQYGRGSKMYYQLNWSPMSAGQTVESFSSEQAVPVLEKISNVWEKEDFGALPTANTSFFLSPGQAMDLWNRQGPATITAFTMNAAMNDPAVLRNVILKIYWDELGEPSVAVPLGDFFGSVWKRWRAQAMFFGSDGDNFFCRFPMPFQKNARFVLENKSSQKVSMKFGIQTGAHIAGGYFHACWRNSLPGDIGVPHTVLKTFGRGRYAGCILAVDNSFDRSFWALESDESMVIDGKKNWQGTGLEDYFNSGWYYGSVFARPLHGLPDKAPFRTVQYRIHLTEPVIFNQSFKMEFERGPNQASHAAYESIAFYYLETPQDCDSRLENRKAPDDPLRKYTLMTDLWNFERFGDLAGEVAYIESYIQQYNPSFTDILKARAQACLYEMGQGGMDGLPDELRRLYTEPNTAVVQLYCNMPSDLYLDGEKILSGYDPQLTATVLVSLEKGRHVLAVSSVWHPYPAWTQVAVRTADGFLIGTSGHWKHAVNPPGNWALLDYDDSTWFGFSDYNARVKGPPEEPYVWVAPDLFVNTLSQASGLRPSMLWGSRQGRVVYRTTFELE